MELESKEKSGPDDRTWSVGRAESWIVWHLAATLAIGLGVVILTGTGFTPGAKVASGRISCGWISHVVASDRPGRTAPRMAVCTLAGDSDGWAGWDLSCS